MRVSDPQGVASATPVVAAEFGGYMQGLDLAPDTQALAVAVSGGPDSMALCRLAHDWAVSAGLTVYALTVDHRLRGEAADEAEQVSQWLEPLGLRHEILVWRDGETVKHLDRSPQAAARDGRFELMADWCAKHHVSYLLTAHHADDQAETFLMRLMRGSGVDGLAAMVAKTTRGPVEILRPLLGVTKADLIATCDAFQQPWVQDPSNESDAYTRTRVRKLMVGLEQEGLGRDRLLKTVSHMQRAQAAIDSAVADLMAFVSSEEETGAHVLDVGRFLKAPDEVALRCLAECLKSVSGATYPPRFDSLERVFLDLKSGHWTDRTLHGCQLRLGEKRLIISKEAQKRRFTGDSNSESLI